MPGRRRARELGLQVLYAVDIGGMTPMVALDSIWSVQENEEPLSAEEIAFTTELVRGVTSAMADIDTRIEAASLNWRLSRMPAVDRNILRIGTWELINRKDIPVSVSINEAIELAKCFGSAESRAFVNGLLDRIAGETGRGGRRRR